MLTENSVFGSDLEQGWSGGAIPLSQKPWSEISFQIAKYRGFYATEPYEQVTTTLGGVLAFLLNNGQPYLTADKHKAPYFTGPLREAPFVGKTLERKKRGGLDGADLIGIQRSKGHSLGGQIFKFDLDDAPMDELAFIRKRIKDSGLAAAMFTTWSHGKTDAYRGRLLVFGNRLATVDEFAAVSEFLGRKLVGKTYDPSEHRCYQLAGVWSCHPDRADLAKRNGQPGLAVDIDGVLELVRWESAANDPAQTPGSHLAPVDNSAAWSSSMPFSISRNKTAIQGALAALDYDSEPDWWAAVKAVKGGLGLAEATAEDKKWLWDSFIAWARQSAKFESAEQQRRKLDSSRAEHPRTLFVRAAERGWANPGEDRQFEDLPEEMAWIGDFNQRYCPTLRGGKMAVAFLSFDETLNREMWNFVSFEAFRQMHCADYGVTGFDAKGQPIVKSKGSWLNHPRRADNREFYFDPGQPVKLERPGFLNMWIGFAVTAPSAGGTAEPMIRHIREVLAQGDPARFAYMLGWIALLIQRPGMRHEVALVLRGGKGSGKGTLGNLICRIFGRHGLALSVSRHLTGNFNDHLMDCCFLFADEAFFAGDKANESALKARITEPTLSIEPKGVALFTVVNRLSVLMATNAEYVVPASADERRYAVFDVSPSRIKDRAYFRALHEWAADDRNVAAFIEFLREYDLSDFDVREVPETHELAEQRNFTLTPMAQWWRDALARGGFNPDHPQWYEIVTNAFLYQSYLRYVGNRRFGRHDIEGDTQMGKFIDKHRLAGATKRRRITPESNVPASISDRCGATAMCASDQEGSERRNCRVIGSLEQARGIFTKAFSLPANLFDDGSGTQDDGEK